MDPIGAIKVAKDTTFAMLLAAQKRGWSLHYLEMGDLFVRDGEPLARMRALSVTDDPAVWHRFTGEAVAPLAGLDILLMRKDPPVDAEYIYATQLLELAARRGVLVSNDPRGLRDFNEKLFLNQFPQCAPPTLVTRSAARIREFAAEHTDIVLKPLDGMGGLLIFRINRDEPNVAVIIESLTRWESRYVMAQKFLPQIADGDKRILMIDGEPVEYALARVPRPGDFRGNLAAGGRGEGVPLGERDRWICAQVGPVLRERQLHFVGLDVIGDYLTEINVTSPTCARELERIYGIDIAGRYLDVLERRRGRR
jgi:glutathione synthase